MSSSLTSSLSQSDDGISHDIYLLGLPAPALVAAQEAARLGFPHGQVKIVGAINEIEAGNCERCLVVLGHPDSAATLTAHASGSPQCAVVVLGPHQSDLTETVPPEEWNPPLLVRVFKSALLEHELLRENIRLRGDLKTVARRVSHDLRTPIGCIYTTSDVFKELPPGDAESIASMASIIKESAAEISLIVDRVSFILKASADPITPSRVDMGGVLATACRQLEAEIQLAKAKIDLPSSWPEVSGVSSWLAVVWTNLLKNAIQHGGPSARVQVEWKSGNGYCQFSVRDHGHGVSADHLAGLFSPFDQMHALHVHGLGLSFVQRLIFLQGGRCGYEEAVDGGARFYFTLPVVR